MHTLRALILALSHLVGASESGTRPFQPFTGFSSADGVTFLEQFSSASSLGSRWILTSATKEGQGDSDLLQYRGQWSIESPQDASSSIPADMGLVMKTAAAHHGISARFPAEISLKDTKLFTVQYEVNLQEGLECGGAYLKLVPTSSKYAQDKLTDKVPYTIMFGPDRCGSTNKVHLILQYTNPRTHEVSQHALQTPPSMHVARQPVLYTLRIRPETDEFEILVDGKVKRKGSLKEELEPPVQMPEKIPDPEDKKPEDWVDNPKIVDPSATKPDDWVDEEEIEDMNAQRPEGWVDEDMTPDPKAQKPDDWDEQQNGKWEPTFVRNPACDGAPGCGPWKRPKIRNPSYKGPWQPPQIDNPAYNGPWKAREITNPSYVKIQNIAESLEPISMIFFELWTVQPGIMFDNILITTTADQALIDSFTKETFEVKASLHEVAREAKKVKFGDVRVEPAMQFSTQGLATFSEMMMKDPVKAVTNFPILFGVTLMVVLGVPALLFSFTRTSEKPEHEKEPAPMQKQRRDSKDSEERVEDKTEEKEAPTRRRTRSTEEVNDE